MNILIVGKDQYLINKEINKVLNSYDKNNVDKIVYDNNSDSFTIKDIINELNTLPFLVENKVVIVYNPLFLKNNNDSDLELLKQYYDHPVYEVSLVIVANDYDARLNIFKYIKSKSNYIECNAIDDNSKANIINQYIKENNIKINKEGKELLFNYLDNDSYSIYSQLDKLNLYNGNIDEKLVNTLISQSLDAQAFDLSGAIGENDIDKALHLYNKLILLGNQPVALVALLASNFRFLYQVCVASELGMDNNQIATLLNVKPGRIYYANKKLAYLNSDKCSAILQLLAKLDQDIKIGNVDANFGFEITLLKCREVMGR